MKRYQNTEDLFTQVVSPATVEQEMKNDILAHLNKNLSLAELCRLNEDVQKKHIQEKKPFVVV